MFDIVKEAEQVIFHAFLIESINFSHMRNHKYIDELKKLPKGNHVDNDFLALKPKPKA